MDRTVYVKKKCNTVPVQPYALLKMNINNIWYGDLPAA